MNAHHSTTTFTQTDEEEDARILRENLAREAFREWPNDAGVSKASVCVGSSILFLLFILK